MRVFVFNSGLFYIQPTPASLDLLDRIAYRLDHENGWDQAIFNEASPKFAAILHRTDQMLAYVHVCWRLMTDELKCIRRGMRAASRHQRQGCLQCTSHRRAWCGTSVKQ